VFTQKFNRYVQLYCGTMDDFLNQILVQSHKYPQQRMPVIILPKYDAIVIPSNDKTLDDVFKRHNTSYWQYFDIGRQSAMLIHFSTKIEVGLHEISKDGRL